MVKCETLGMLDIAKINPVLKSDKEVANYSFMTVDGITYLIHNEFSGDDTDTEDTTIAAGDYLNGYDLQAWIDQKLIIDGKHITGGVAAATAGKILTVGTDGTLAVADAAPESGIYLKVTDVDANLTEPAVKAVICMA